MRRLSLLALVVLSGLPSVFACSLRSLDDLQRCTGEPASTECPVPGAASGVAGTPSGGAAAGGTVGDAGSVAVDPGGAPGVEGGAAGAAPEPLIKLLYADHPPDNAEPVGESKAIRPIFEIVNDSDAPLDMSELAIRYYYTLEAPIMQVFECDFVNRDLVVNDCAGVLGSFGTLTGEAKNYVEITFQPPGKSWLISEFGGRSGPIQVRFYKDKFATQDQGNDYSYDPSKVDVPEPWGRVTLYRAGSLIWGQEPE